MVADKCQYDVKEEADMLVLHQERRKGIVTRTNA